MGVMVALNRWAIHPGAPLFPASDLKASSEDSLLQGHTFALDPWSAISRQDFPSTSVLDSSFCIFTWRRGIIVISSLVALALNALVLISLTCGAVREGSNHRFLVTILAANDLIAALCLAIMSLGSVTLGCSPLGGKNGCSALGWVFTTSVVGSIRIVVLLTLERYISIVRPLFHFRKVTASSVIRTLIAILLLTLTEGVFVLSGLLPPFRHYEDSLLCAYELSPLAGHVAHQVLLIIHGVEGLVAVLVVNICNTHIGIVLERCRRAAAMSMLRGSLWAVHSEGWQRRVTNVSLSVPFLSFVHTLCYAPFAAILLYNDITKSEWKHEILHSITGGLLLLAPLLNPIGYFLFNSNYRAQVADRFLCSTRDKQLRQLAINEALQRKPSCQRSLSSSSTISTISSVSDHVIPVPVAAPGFLIEGK